MKNKLLRLAEIIQEDFPEDLVEAFRSSGNLSLDERISLVSAARSLHQQRSETLWLQAGKQRTPEEKSAAARADLAAFLFAYLTGDAKEYAETAIEALQVLGRHAEVDLVGRLTRR